MTMERPGDCDSFDKALIELGATIMHAAARGPGGLSLRWKALGHPATAKFYQLLIEKGCSRPYTLHRSEFARSLIPVSNCHETNAKARPERGRFDDIDDVIREVSHRICASIMTCGYGVLHIAWRRIRTAVDLFIEVTVHDLCDVPFYIRLEDEAEGGMTG